MSTPRGNSQRVLGETTNKSVKLTFSMKTHNPINLAKHHHVSTLYRPFRCSPYLQEIQIFPQPSPKQPRMSLLDLSFKDRHDTIWEQKPRQSLDFPSHLPKNLFVTLLLLSSPAPAPPVRICVFAAWEQILKRNPWEQWKNTKDILITITPAPRELTGKSWCSYILSMSG